MYIFWSKVEVRGLEECWPWIAAVKSNGYPAFSAGPRYNLSQKASRAVYELTRGPIPPDLHILHRCDNKLCCNPCHVRADTRQANMDDMVARGRAASGERNAATKLSPEQVGDIREDPRTLAVLSRAYGVSKGLISRIKSGKRRIQDK